MFRTRISSFFRYYKLKWVSLFIDECHFGRCSQNWADGISFPAGPSRKVKLIGLDASNCDRRGYVDWHRKYMTNSTIAVHLKVKVTESFIYLPDRIRKISEGSRIQVTTHLIPFHSEGWAQSFQRNLIQIHIYSVLVSNTQE